MNRENMRSCGVQIGQNSQLICSGFKSTGSQSTGRMSSDMVSSLFCFDFVVSLVQSYDRGPCEWVVCLNITTGAI